MAMKQTDELKEQVAGVTECPICTEKLNNNRLLPCGHTFCLKCLELYKKQANPKGKSLPCPICRREFGIPKGGCSSLTKNFAVEQLIGAQKPAKNDDLAQCDVCDPDRRMAAILFCIQCEQNLCVDCERTHQKMKSTSMHPVVPISKKNQMRHSMSKNYCEHHVDQGLELVCSDCNEAICWKCKSLTHQSHKCVEINEAADQCVEQLKLDFDETENRIFMLNKISAHVKDISKQQHESFEIEKSNIAKTSADMIRTIVANEEKLMKQLEVTFMRTMKTLRPQEDRVDKQLEELKQQKASVKQTLECGQPWKIFRSTTALHDRTAELMKLNMIDIEEISTSKLSELQIREHLIGNKPIVQENMSKRPPPPLVSRQTTPSTVTTVENMSQHPPTPPIPKQMTPSTVTTAEIMSQHPPTPPIPKQMTPSTVTTAENMSQHPPTPPIPKQMTPSTVTTVENKSKHPPTPPIALQTTPSTVTTAGNKSKRPPPPPIKLVPLSDKAGSSSSSGYVNCSQIQQNTCVEQTPPNKETVGNSLQKLVPLSDKAGSSSSSGYVNCSQIQENTCVEQTPPNKETVGNSLQKRESVSHWSKTSTVGKINGDCKAIIGVTVLRQKVYVIHDDSPQIQAYDSNTLNWLSDFKLKDLQEPKHLTSCALNNCLYLTGLKDQTVFKTEGTGDKVLLKWKSEGDAYSLSTTKDGTVVLAGSITQTLKEYTAYGVPTRTIILKHGLSMPINPCHALKLESGNYLISHGQSRTSKHRVCMISPDGVVIKSFGDEKGSGMNGLFGPYHLALDEKGNVLVADCNNRRIVVLSPDLQYVTEIKTELRCPTRLCFDPATTYLYVADNELRTGGKRTDGQLVVLGYNQNIETRGRSTMYQTDH